MRNMISGIRFMMAAGSLTLMGCGGTATTPSSTSAAVFVGSWRNIDSQTGGITRIAIRGEGSALFVEEWGACVPTDCYWGEVSTSLTQMENGALPVLWTFPQFKVTTQTLTINSKGQLQASTHNHFIDNSARPDNDSVAVFIKGS